MREATRESYEQRILRVLVHIQGHLDEPMPLEELAAVAHFSPYHFHRIFRGMVGESVSQHIRRLRLERAAHRLRFTRQPVTTIALDAGYDAHEAFTRAFRATFGESPSCFRRLHRRLQPRPSPSGVHYVADGEPITFRPGPGDGTALPVRLVTLEPMRVAFVRHTGPYEQVQSAWEKLMAWAGPRGLLGREHFTCAIVHDDPDVTPPQRIRYDACVQVSGDFAGEADVGAGTIRGGEYAVAAHHGPYERLSQTYARLFGRWLRASGREAPWEPCLEVYRNSLRDVSPAELLTDIYLPLEPT